MNTDERLNDISKKLDKWHEEYNRDKYKNLGIILGALAVTMLGIYFAKPTAFNLGAVIAFFIFGSMLIVYSGRGLKQKGVTMWLSNMWGKYKGYCILGFITLITSLMGTIAWFVNYIASLADLSSRQQATSPIGLAAVTASLGGLILVGAFYRGKDERATPEEREHTIDLKFVGKLILLSSVCFIITFFLVEYVRLITSPTLSPIEWFYIIVTDVVAVIAGLSISIALSLLVTIVRFL